MFYRSPADSNSAPLAWQFRALPLHQQHLALRIGHADHHIDMRGRKIVYVLIQHYINFKSFHLD